MALDPTLLELADKYAKDYFMGRGDDSRKRLQAAITVLEIKNHDTIERLKPFAEVGGAMVEITTTVRGPEEWPAIPTLWLKCMEERDKAKAELSALKRQEPEAMRHSPDGYGWRYIDSGSGSDWETRHPESEPLIVRPK